MKPRCSLSKAEFKRVAEEAMENIRKRKKAVPTSSSSGKEVAAYA